MIVSGLAYGIDIVAHRTALKARAATRWAAWRTGWTGIYPGEHAATAKEMLRPGRAR
jgi:DNA processing protein